MRFKKSILGISLLAMSVGLVGCGTSNNTTGQMPQNRTNQISRNMTTGRYEATKRGSVRNSMMGSERGELLNTENSYDNQSMGSGKTSDLARMERIQSRLNQIQGYNDATCVVNGNTAIVGCSNNANKNEIVNIVKKCDPSINRCEVITTREGKDRISKMAEDIRKGNIGQTMSQDFRKMWDDILGY